MFEADSPRLSMCYGACASVWPPVTTSSSPAVAGGNRTGVLGTLARAYGQVQLTYDGHPLYYYSGDAKPGDTSGEGLNHSGAQWYLLSPAGQPVIPGQGP